MRVLLVHNRYRSSLPSGENRVVDEEAARLQDAGHHVTRFERDSDDLALRPLARLRALPGPVYSPTGVRDFADALRASRPDVVHVHNVNPLISPWVARTARRQRVPVVHTVHNFRHLCVAGTLYRDGHQCTDCVGRAVGWPGVAHACYRDSRAQSAAMVAGQAVHRSTWRAVDLLMPISRYLAGSLQTAGFAAEQLMVRYNGLAESDPPKRPGRGAVFVGRLDEEKGVMHLISAWRATHSSEPLTIVGDGPLRAEVSAAVTGLPAIRFVGAVPPGEVRSHLDSAAFLVLPSRCYEGGPPRVVLEALQAGRPVVAARHGAVPEAIDDEVGWLVEPTEEGLLVGLREALAANDLERRAAAAHRRFRGSFTAQRSLDTLVQGYRRAVESGASSG